MIDSGWNPTILEDIRTMFADQVRFLEWSNKSGYDYRRSVGCFKQNLTVRDEIDLTKKVSLKIVIVQSRLLFNLFHVWHLLYVRSN